VLLLCLVLFLSVAFGDEEFNGPQYESQTRGQKIDQLWHAIESDPENLDWYSALSVAEIFVESMDTTFETLADDMPQQYIGNFFERKKLIHTVGVIARAELKITNTTSGFTGIFATGCDSVLIRLSLAKKPLEEKGTGAYAPGIAVKFLRDGLPSGNVVSMFSLAGQDGFNFFEHDFTNHVPSPNPAWMDTAEKLLLAKFRTASTWPTMVGLSDLASYDQNGRKQSSPRFPYRLIWHPSSKLHNAFPDEPTGQPFYSQLMRALAPGEVLYELYIQAEPLQTNLQLIKLGEVVLTSEGTTSKFGDRHFFHRHQLFEDDLQLRPDWVSGATTDINIQESAPSRPGFEYGDLPFKK